MKLRRVGVIGWGSIGQTLLQAWAQQPVPGHQAVALLVRPAQLQAARDAAADLPAGLRVTADAAEFLATPLDLVVEAAGQGAVRELGEAVLHSGRDLMLLSVGALTDDALRERLQAQATEAGVRLLLPVGAIAGLDGLLALRRAGLQQVRYTSTKPPAAWKGTAAEQMIDLDAITGPTRFFSGTAREAAAQFPKNANLAATVALAGLGLDHTRVELVADPAARGNHGQIEAQGLESRLSVTVAGLGSASNPKSSRITGLSVLSALANAASPLGYV